MIKKTLFVVGGAVLVGGLLFGANMRSYVATTGGWVKDSVKDKIPVRFEINRARTMIRDLKGPIRDSMHIIAKEDAGVERLQRDLERRESILDKSQRQVMRLKDDLARGGSTFVYAGRNFTEKQVRTDLTSRFASYKTQQSTLDNLRQILTARQNGLEAARQKLIEMQAAKSQLEVDVENLEARLKMVEVAQTASELSIDDSQLSRTKQLVSDLHGRLDVLAKLSAAETSGGAIPLDEPEVDNIVDEVAEYFSSGSPSVANVADGSAAK